MKRKSSTDKQSLATEVIKSQIFRAGDTVSVNIPMVKYKDTVIYTYSRQGTTLRTVYDQSGNVSNIDCMSAAIKEQTETLRTLLTADKSTDKEKTEKFDSSFILYIILGVVLCFGLALVFLHIQIKKNSAVVNALMSKLS